MKEEKLRPRKIPLPTETKLRDRFLCPECNNQLPFDAVTECDNCGAHLELYVKVITPSISNE